MLGASRLQVDLIMGTLPIRSDQGVLFYLHFDPPSTIALIATRCNFSSYNDDNSHYHTTLKISPRLFIHPRNLRHTLSSSKIQCANLPTCTKPRRGAVDASCSIQAL